VHAFFRSPQIGLPIRPRQLVGRHREFGLGASRFRALAIRYGKGRAFAGQRTSDDACLGRDAVPSFQAPQDRVVEPVEVL
jgi:hypothetical protein